MESSMKRTVVLGSIAIALAAIACNSSSDTTNPGNGSAGSAGQGLAGQTQSDAQLPDVTPDPDSSDPDATNPSDVSNDADASSKSDVAESGLPLCTDEVDLEREQLPCDCYGHEANATTIVDPDCVTQVVCCPSIGNLRCEDHEFVTDGGWQMDNIAPCIDETDLSTQRLPCNCYGTVVSDVKKDMPTCNDIVKCCPVDHGLKCEAP
jgi:hypothetical protein